MENKYTSPDFYVLDLTSVTMLCVSTGEQYQDQQDITGDFDWNLGE